MESEYDSLLSNKEDEIDALKLLGWQSSKSEIPSKEQMAGIGREETNEVFKAVIQDRELIIGYGQIAKVIEGDTELLDKLSDKTISFFESRKLVKRKEKGVFSWTPKGDYFNVLLMTKKIWDEQ